jgi:hypothetical protein
VFVGQVVETIPTRHPAEKDSYTFGYSMRFTVEESIRGDPAADVTIETGSGGGDCGTPLSPGQRFLIFATKAKDGKLWTGSCSGNELLSNDAAGSDLIERFRKLVTPGKGALYGTVTYSRPVWKDDDVTDDGTKKVPGLTLRATSSTASVRTRTTKEGSYSFEGLPNGTYTIVPELKKGWDYDHEYPEKYEQEISDGGCAIVDFNLLPDTRIKGHITPPPGRELGMIEVTAIPTNLKNLNQFSGKWDFTDEDGRVDLWPLPPGDYYVGVNINSSPKLESPYPPTYYPGVTEMKAASVVHVYEGEVKEINLPLPEVAQPRIVNFVATGLDGKPLKAVYVQLEDLRHRDDAFSYVNVDLDGSGAGTLTVYSGYSYHLHASHWVSAGTDGCAKPVLLTAGSEPVKVHFTMDHSAGNCQLTEIDKQR